MLRNVWVHSQLFAAWSAEYTGLDTGLGALLDHTGGVGQGGAALGGAGRGERK